MNKIKTNSQKIEGDGFLIFYRLGYNGYVSGIYRGKRQFPRKARKKDFSRT